MDYIRFAISNPVKVTVGVLLLLLFGALAVTAIPIQLTPNVDQPIITIETAWVGRSPDEVEREIIEEQEDKLKSISGLKKMSATAYEGQANISLEFFVGVDMNEAVREVSDKLREVPEYPADVDEPVINVSASSSETPIAWTVLTSEDPDFEIEGIRDIVEDRIKPYLERVDGLSEVKVYGGREREVHVRVNPRRMADWGVTYSQLRDVLRKTNINISAGNISEGRLDVRVRTVGEYNDLEKISQTIVAYTDGGPVRIRDVADVTLHLEKLRGFVRSKGRRALALPAYREVGANVMEVMTDLRQRIAEVRETVLPSLARQIQIERGLPEPPKFHYEQVYDETVYIDDAIDLVQSNIWIGGSLAAVILLIFLRSFRPTVIIAMAIPISVIGTFVAMTAAGRSINVISLAGLAFAVGMVVDAAIVVLENIDRHLSMGKQPARAAYDGAREVGAILASTLTTLAVFVPVLFIEEEAGQLFRDIALAICAAVTLSLVVSVTVIPTAAAHGLRVRRAPKWWLTRSAKQLFGVTTVLDRGVAAFAGFIHWITRPSFGRVLVRLLVVGAVTVASVYGAAWLMPPTTYLPPGNRNLVFGFIMTPPSYTKAHDESIGRRIERRVRPYYEASSYEQTAKLEPVLDPRSGRPIERVPPIENFFFVSIFRGMFTGAVSADKTNVKPIGALLTSAISEIPGAYGGAFQRSLFSRGLGGNNRIDVEVTGFDMDDIRRSAEALFGELAARFGVNALRPNPGNFNLPGPEERVEIDPVRAADLGIDVTELGLAVQALVDGTTVGDFRIGGKSIDILLVRDPAYDLSLERLEMVPLAAKGADGAMTTVPLGSVANFRPADAPQTIARIEEQRAVTIEVSPPVEIPLEQAEGEILAMIRQLREDGTIPPGVQVVPAGSADKLTQVRRSLLGTWHGWTWESLRSLAPSRMFLALVVTYLLMAALFESFVYPLVIMFSVPLAAVGGFIGLAIAHAIEPTQQLDVLTMLGFVILIGVVVNNAILIVHQALNFMRGEGDAGESGRHAGERLSPREALRQSVRTRVRPVLMTTMTSVFGMLPLVIMPGSGSELYRGLGSVVIGGLVVSTVFTLLVVPLVFSLVLDLKLAIGRPAEQVEHPLKASPVG